MNPGQQSEQEILRRIQAALEVGSAAVSGLPVEVGPVSYKPGRDPVTQADRLLDDVLRRHLFQTGEIWVSEESGGDTQPPRQGRVWVVDPLDGTREYVAGVPEWCLSVLLVEDGQGVAGGICNPRTGEMFLGSRAGVTYNGRKAAARNRSSLAGAEVLASRSEFGRGEWERFRNAGFTVKPMGSVAYKLALVAAGLADATWTLLPKHGWDVAAGAFLVEVAGGFVCSTDGTPLNLDPPGRLISGMVAGAAGLRRDVLELLTNARS